ncbi:DEAD/DEAH box helicase [Aeromonas piscicola]|uniref:DEAD/DEAH box helicase n=1 Tax=Aeromonas piscicola TaxID=600645 RepID=UPI0005B53B46|nr:DEAD/DEAH box helicase [Aeromonas piscicola]
MEARWEVQGRSLVYIDDLGVVYIPSTSEIFSALVEHNPLFNGMPSCFDGVKVTKYPLIPTLVVKPDCAGLPHYSIKAGFRDIQVLLDQIDLERGHIVVDSIWYPLEPKVTSDLLELLNENGITPGPASSLKTFLAVCKADLSDGPVTDLTAGGRFLPNAFTPDGSEVPHGVNGTLYPYQLSGWRWLKFLIAEGCGGLLADEMGLGKTLQIIAALTDSGRGPLSPALIVAPGSLLENWSREITKFAPSLSVLKHHGPLRTGRPTVLANHDVVVTSYDMVIGDNSLLNMVRWKVVVLDEAQFIRNPDAKRTKAVKRLNRDAGLAVTGTPIENRLQDVWSIIDFVNPNYLGDQQAFASQFQNDPEGAQKLEPLISPLMLRRRVVDVATDLPPRIYIPQMLVLEDTEAAAYDAERERIYAEYGAAATLVALTSLRRFCAHPSLMSGTHGVSDPLSFTKMRRLDEIVEEIFSRQEKVLIFTSFTSMADMIACHIEKRFGSFAGVIDGRLPIDERQPLIDRFSGIQGGAALILNPRAGGAGLNIVAANHVIHYNPEWNPALEDQASARAHRRGQQLPVTVHRLLIAGTVEDVVNDRLSRKRDLSDAAIIGIEGKDEDYNDIVAALTRSPTR